MLPIVGVRKLSLPVYTKVNYFSTWNYVVTMPPFSQWGAPSLQDVAFILELKFKNTSLYFGVAKKFENFGRAKVEGHIYQ